MNKPIIIGNWKMQLSMNESKTLIENIMANVGQVTGTVGVCPSFPALTNVKQVLGGSPLLLGAQDLHSEDSGRFTGAVSPIQLEDTGCKLVIIGHSERRAFFAETNDSVNKKVAAALRHHVMPVLCIGETKEQRDAGRAEAVVREQITTALQGQMFGSNSVIVAYEPVWAISPNPPAKPEDALAMLPVITSTVNEVISGQVAVFVIYGGSADDKNIIDFVGSGKFDGVLPGNASLDAEKFCHMIKRAQEVFSN